MAAPADTLISETNLSRAWLATLQAVRAATGGAQFHVVTRISEPCVEEPAIRDAADLLMASRPMEDPIETVANTIFPAAMAASSTSSDVLVSRYRAALPTLQRIDTNNGRGTYFGRIVAYAGPDGPVDQLGTLIKKLKHEQTNASPKTARYEVGIEQPENDASTGDPGPDLVAPVYVPGRDNSIMSFPCLSMCSFQLHRTRLHLLAHYRSQLIVRRGYGNYLGLARLLSYVADQTGLTPGAITVVAGRATADIRVKDLAAFTNTLAD